MPRLLHQLAGGNLAVWAIGAALLQKPLPLRSLSHKCVSLFRESVRVFCSENLCGHVEHTLIVVQMVRAVTPGAPGRHCHRSHRQSRQRLLIGVTVSMAALGAQHTEFKSALM